MASPAQGGRFRRSSSPTTQHYYSYSPTRPAEPACARTPLPRQTATPAAPLATPPPDAAASVACVFKALHSPLSKPSQTYSPIIVRGVNAETWKLFREKYAEHPVFKGPKFEYDGVKEKIIALPLAKPLHNIANKVMNKQVYLRMSTAGLDSERRIRSLNIDRENFEKQSADGKTSQREPDSAVWTANYHSGIIPTIIWEVGHSQKRSSLFRRAKMWCRRYDGKVHVIILVKYLCKDPRLNNSSILEVYRPALLPRIPGELPRWTARKDGPTYTLFPRPAEDDHRSAEDVVPLTYRDYFGEGNVGPGVDPTTRFDLPLELVRKTIELVVSVTERREQYRYISGGSSIGGADLIENIMEEVLQAEQNEKRDQGNQFESRGTPEGSGVEMEEYEADGDNWDMALSDVSESDRENA